MGALYYYERTSTFNVMQISSEAASTGYSEKNMSIKT